MRKFFKGQKDFTLYSYYQRLVKRPKYNLLSKELIFQESEVPEISSYFHKIFKKKRLCVKKILIENSDNIFSILHNINHKAPAPFFFNTNISGPLIHKKKG